MKTKIYCISDQKIGHIRQTEGLALALQAEHNTEIEWIDTFKLWDILRSFGKVAPDIQQNSIVIGAGHRTHFALLWYKWRYHCKSIVIMNPSLPKCWFDFCIVPRHDGLTEEKNVLVTDGAMNVLSLKPIQKQKQLIILIGGPSKACHWNNAVVYTELERLLSTQLNNFKVIQLTTSRRTPVNFLQQLPSYIADNVECFNYQDLPQSWLLERLLESSDVAVTADSVSMIYEALSADCSVNIINVPLVKGKIADNVQYLRYTGRVDACKNDEHDRLNEATRIAQCLIQRGIIL